MIPSIAEVKRGIVLPTLDLLPPEMRGQSAVNGVTGVGAAESEWFRYERQIDGPALSWFMIQPGTHDDCWANFIRYRPALQTALSGLLRGAAPSAGLLPGNERYACAMARVVLYRAPEPLPDADDALGWARYHVRWYNRGGAATVEHDLPYFEAALAA